MMEGPFAEQLQKALAGRKNAPVSSDRGAKNTKEGRKLVKGGVNGKDVHSRLTAPSLSREMILSPETPLIDLNEARTEAERELRERKKILEQALLETLKPMTELSEKVISIQSDFSTLVRLANLKTDPTVEVESDNGKESISIRVLMQELFDEASTLAEVYQRDAAELGQVGYERTLNRFQVILDEMEELFRAFREAVDKERKAGVGSPSNNEVLPGGPNPISPPGGGQGSGDDPSSHETKENVSFEEKLVSLEAKIVEWRGVRQELLELIGDRQYERFIAESGPVGALARGRILKEVEARIAEYRQVQEKGEELGGEATEWLDHHMHGMQDIIAMGIALRDQIRSERAPDPVQAKQTSPQKPEEGSGPAGAGELPDPVVTNDYEWQNYADISDEYLEHYWHILDRGRDGGVTERILAVKEQMERWEKLSQAIAETGDANRVGHDLASALDIPETSIRVQKDETLEQALERKISKLTDLALGFSKKRVNALLSELERKQAAGERIEDREFGLLKGDFFNYHRLLVAGEKILADIRDERDRETPIIAAEQAARTARENESKESADAEPRGDADLPERRRLSIQEKIARAQELLERWEELVKKVGAHRLISEIKKKYPKAMLPHVKGIGEWIEKHADSEQWGSSRSKYRTRLNYNLKDLEGVVGDAELVVSELRSASKTAEPKRAETDPSLDLREGDVWVREKDGKFERMALGAIEGEKISFTYSTHEGGAPVSWPMKGKSQIDKLRARLQSEGYEPERKGKRVVKKVSAEPVIDTALASKEVHKDNQVEAAALDRALAEADELVARWELLGDRVGFGPLKEGIRQLNKHGFKFPPVSDVRDWLAEKKATGDWSEDERHDLVYEAVPSLKQQLAWAETVAAQLPEKKVAPQRTAAESMVGAGDPEGERKREETAITFLEHRQQERLEALGKIETKEAFDQYAGRERHQLYSLDGDIDIEAVRHFLRKKGFVQESAVERIHARAQALQDEVKEAYAVARAKFYPDEAGGAQAERAPADIPADAVVQALDTWLAVYSGKRDVDKGTDQKIARSLKGVLKDYAKLTETMTHPGISTKLPEGLHDLALASQAENPEALIRQRGQVLTEALAALGNPTELSEANTEQAMTIIHSFGKECRDIRRAFLPEVRMQELEERSRIFLNAYNAFFAVGDQIISDDPESPVEKLKSRVHDSYGEFLVQKEKFPEYSRGTEVAYRAFQSELGNITDELIGSFEELKRIMKRKPVASKTRPDAEPRIQESRVKRDAGDLNPGAGSGMATPRSGSDKKPEVVVPVVEAAAPIQKAVEASTRTEWERLEPAERQTVNQKMLGLRNRFVIELNAELKRENIVSPVERKKIIETVLAKYVRTILQQKTEVSVSFTESELDALVVELVKDVTPT